MRLLLLLLTSFLSLNAFATTTYVAPAGSDINDCLTWPTACSTIQAAADKSSRLNPSGQWADVAVADGTYTCGLDIAHFRMVRITGDIANPGALVINQCAGGFVFYVEDHSTLVISGMTLQGGNLLQARQFSILDYDHINFGPANVHVYAFEMSKINCGPSNITGSAVYFAVADTMSTVNLNCAHSISPGLTFTQFIACWNRSLVISWAATFSGSISGQSYTNDASMINGVSKIPGTPGSCSNGCIEEN